MSLFNFNKWLVKATIINKRADGGYNVESDKLRRITKKDGKEEWRRRRGNEAIPPVLYDYLSNNNHVFLVKDKNGQYGRATVDVNEDSIKGLPTDITNWIIDSKEEGRKLYENPSFFAKYGNFIMATGILIAIGVMIYISLDKIIELNQIGAGALENVKMLLEQKCVA